MKKILSSLMLAGAMFTMNAVAQEAQTTSSSIGNLKLGLGVSYRNFHTVELKGGSMDAVSGYSIGSPNLSNLYSQYSQINIPGAYTTGYYVHADGFNCNGSGHFGFGESCAPVLSASLPLWQNDNLSLEAIGNFQFYNLDTAASGSGSGVVSYYTTTYIASSDTANGQFATNRNPQWQTMTGYGYGGKTKFDLQLYVFDLGLKANYALIDNLEAFAACGPSLHYADMESSCSLGTSNDNQFAFGVYCAAGAQYMFSEQFGLSAEARYDEVFEHFDTKYANLNPDSWSTIIKLVYQF